MKTNYPFKIKAEYSSEYICAYCGLFLTFDRIGSMSADHQNFLWGIKMSTQTETKFPVKLFKSVGENLLKVAGSVGITAGLVGFVDGVGATVVVAEKLVFDGTFDTKVLGYAAAGYAVTALIAGTYYSGYKMGAAKEAGKNPDPETPQELRGTVSQLRPVA